MFTPRPRKGLRLFSESTSPNRSQSKIPFVRKDRKSPNYSILLSKFCGVLFDQIIDFDSIKRWNVRRFRTGFAFACLATDSFEKVRLRVNVSWEFGFSVTIDVYSGKKISPSNLAFSAFFSLGLFDKTEKVIIQTHPINTGGSLHPFELIFREAGLHNTTGDTWKPLIINGIQKTWKHYFPPKLASMIRRAVFVPGLADR